MTMATRAAASSGLRIEWRTAALIAAMWAGYGAVTLMWQDLGWGLAAPLGAYLICLNGSLQHEAVHGHPTRSARLNEMLLWLPVGLVFPFRRYRTLHLIHHNNDHLTDPALDPESCYLDARHWDTASPTMKLVCTFNNSFAGRMLIGPALATARFASDELRLIARGDRAIAIIWLWHLAGIAMVWAWITQVCGMSFLHYAMFMAYPGLSLTLMRSFAEHRAHDRTACRTVIVEANPVIALMFLNNNLHMVHHEHPAMPWYALPGYYRAHKQRLLRDNCGYLIKGYWRVIARYALAPKEPVKHPLPESLKR